MSSNALLIALAILVPGAAAAEEELACLKAQENVWISPYAGTLKLRERPGTQRPSTRRAKAASAPP